MKLNRALLLAALSLVVFLPFANAAQKSDVANSKHNLTAFTLNAAGDTTDRVCVFCHTPHGATADGGGFVTPLWNRDLSAQTYTLYDDTSIDALKGSSIDATLSQPGGTSKLCLSCHDGTIAIGKVNVINGASTTGDASMPAGDGVTSGFTRNIGVNLQNDHPISFTYDATLASNDGELYTPGSASGAHIDSRVSGAAMPLVPLESGEVQCTTCHDPHVIDDAVGVDNKFIREGLNRFQEVSAPTSDTSFNSNTDILCLACHSKEGWSDSAHAHSTVADETYTTAASTQRDFTSGIAVWQAACLNCHDTHTVQGARKLLREGTDDTNTPKLGGNPAQEETCYQCHDLNGAANNSLNGGGANLVPDIKSDFALLRHMPITTAEQAATSEQHSITDKDFTESTDQLGKTNLNNRHAECTDCHNPHRVLKNRLFNDATGTPDAAGTHDHFAAAGHTNIASGVLSGTTGVEPTYTVDTWGQTDTNISFTLKKGPAGAGTDKTASGYVTREYQVCLKCHSNYAWPDGSPPTIGPSIGQNLVSQYTNQAMEFHAPVADRGELTATHSSWHPVMEATGRTTAVRSNMLSTNFLAPWNSGVGTQTMYCSDCHGSDTGVGSQTVEPIGGENGNPWGPHGSANNFILKGDWDGARAVPGANEICFKCHNRDAYSPATIPAVYPRSGYSCNGCGGGAGMCGMSTAAEDNLHIGHVNSVGQQLRCSWCHAAVPHGWKNKALLVNVAVDAGTTNTPVNQGPYFRNAMLGGNAGGITFQKSGEWTAASCGNRNWMTGNCGGPP